MASIMVIQGRKLDESDIGMIRGLLVAHPDWGRTRLSCELCARWDWHNAKGQPKDMAARTLLPKLERAGHLRLPARRCHPSNERRNRHAAPVAPPDEPVRGPISGLYPLRVSIAAPGSDDARLFNGLLAHEHYLGHRNTVGENIRYLVRDRHVRPVACLLFGSAAWKCADRDSFLGWDHPTRERNLQYLINNLAEQALRFIVIYQRITQGTRGLKGQKTCERLWTVVACLPRQGTWGRQGTCAMQGRSAFDFIHAAVHAHFHNKPAPSLLPAAG